MRIMVTGAEGMLGKEIVARLGREHEVIGVDVADFDITDFAATSAAIAAARPALVCHCAAYTDVDGCEREPDRAFRVNAVGTWNVAAAVLASCGTARVPLGRGCGGSSLRSQGLPDPAPSPRERRGEGADQIPPPPSSSPWKGEESSRAMTPLRRHTPAAPSEPRPAMIYISTDFVFDGAKTEPYTEYDAPNPLGAYGASKLAGERHVRELVPCHFIVRTAWLYAAHGRNFVLSILRKARELAAANATAPSAEPPTLRVVADQIGSPTYAGDLADAIARHIVDSKLYGTYHITNRGSCSWAEFAAEALRLAGSPVRAEPIRSEQWPSPTRRPAYSVLRHYALELQGRDDLRPWQDALAEVVGQIGERGS